MSSRHMHTPRQPERDIRLHEPHLSHSLPPPPHAHPHPPQMNGNGIPTPSPHTGPSRPPALASQHSSAAPPGSANGEDKPSPVQILNQANEQTWLMIGRVAEQMGNLEHALSAYENALRHNIHSLPGLTQVAGIARIKENYPKAVEYFQAALQVQGDNGEVWSALGHCYLMQDDLQKAYAAYQQALYFLSNPKEDPKLWYGIGILYDRYGSLDHAEEAFSSVLKMDKDFDKANEILFRLGIIYKQQQKYQESLECFDRILRNPPSPLAHADIWFQIGHVFEQQRDHVRARDAYERVVQENPNHAKVLQQLGWLYHQDGSSFQNQELAIQYLTKSLEAEPGDAQSWYLLGRAYMAGQKYNKAYEAYQQAVYRDGRNPTFWCSIGVLYFQINQYRDALDAYSRAIRINPYISEVWFDLGSLYESCNNQISDAIDAYARAAELDPNNQAIGTRLQLLKNAQATGQALPAAPGPQDVHPTAYANPLVQPHGLSGPPLMLQGGGGARPLFPTDARALSDLPLPVPPQAAGRNSPGPFRGGPPPPVVLDESRHPQGHVLAPMEDRPPIHGREQPTPFPPPRDMGPRGERSLLLHPSPHPQGPPEPQRHPGHPHDFHPMRVTSTSASPPPHARPRSVAGGHPMQSHYPERPHLGPGQPSSSGRRSPPPNYPREEAGWGRRPPVEAPEWDRERGRPPMDLGRPPSHGYARPHSPPQHRNSSRSMRDRSPPESSPRSAHPGYAGGAYWDPKVVAGAPSQSRRPSPRPTSIHDMAAREPAARYDPTRDSREYEREVVLEPRADPRYAASPEAMRHPLAQPPPLPPPQHLVGNRASESPHLAAQQEGDKRRRGGPPPIRDNTSESNGSVNGESTKKERKRRQPAPQKRVKEEGGRPEGSYDGSPSSQGFRAGPGSKSNVSPEPGSSNGSGSASRSVQPSPTNSTHMPPSRALDEDYDEGIADEGVADSLLNLSTYRDPRGMAAPADPSRMRGISPAQAHPNRRRQSVSSRTSPTNNKRPLSPGPDDQHPDVKRSRVSTMGAPPARVSPSSTSNGRPTPTPTSLAPSQGGRMSPIPFRQQPTSHSPDMRQAPSGAYPPDPRDATSPQLPVMLPPHPRPIGAGHGHGGGGSLPPMSARTPPSHGATPGPPGDEARRSSSPRGGKLAGSPAGAKGTSSPGSAASVSSGGRPAASSS
ncbi:TPR-like protein [Epithele typhae]|uniref:TPR-like protein n=1 Tax=Epithele typhae TaxID=378194 RepID=UPI002007C258|nr:TPR-like protein [Epithele typhae]KAH9938987.1 TPR-like protein [Epithele typhae]